MSPSWPASPLDLIPELDPALALALQQRGVRNVADLLLVGPDRLLTALGDLASRARVERWLRAAWLLQIDHVDSSVAAALIEGGYDQPRALAEAEPDALLALLERLLPSPPSAAGIRDLQASAGVIGDGGALFGRVVDAATGAPLAGLHVKAGGRWTSTDADGAFALSGVPAGVALIEVSDEGYRVASFPVEVRAGALCPSVALSGSRPDLAAMPVLREADGTLLAEGPATPSRARTVPLESLPDGALLYVRELRADGSARLVHADRTMVGPLILIDRVYTDTSAITGDLAIGAVLRWRSGALELTDLSGREVVRARVARLRRAMHGEGRGHGARREAPEGPPTTVKAWVFVDADDGPDCDRCPPGGLIFTERAPLAAEYSHPGCTCEAEQIELKAHEELSYRVVVSSTTMWVEHEPLDNCEGVYVSPVTYWIPRSPYVVADPGMEMEDPTIPDDDLEVEVALPRAQGRVVIEIARTTIETIAERWLVVEDGDLRLPLGSKRHIAEYNVSAEATFRREPCAVHGAPAPR